MNLTHLRALGLIAATAMTSGMTAGNIPQYILAKEGTPYTPLTEATVVREKGSTVVPSSLIFPDGTEAINFHSGAGFPIGFDFRFAGQTHNQFIICPNGGIMLGTDKITFNGQAGSSLGRQNPEHVNSFVAEMTPVRGGAYKGGVSYKTEGEPGSRVLTVQFEEMKVDEAGVVPANQGIYSLQIRLYEGSNKLEFALLENKTVWNKCGFSLGLRGWDLDDQILVNAEGLDKTPNTVASVPADMLDHRTYILWDADDDGNSHNPVFSFTPAPDTPSAGAKPANLTIRQSGRDMVIDCEKGKGADATLIIYSTKPFTDAELPADGTSYRVTDNAGEHTTRIGNATVLYYHTGDKPSATIKDVPNLTPIYVRAYSVNGYPNYNKADFAEASLTATQNAPSSFDATVGARGVKLEWSTIYPVIVASTEEHLPYGMKSYYGIFGQPSADAKPGDMIEGGGMVIYCGDASSTVVPLSGLTANKPTFFRIWSVKDGIVSSTGTDAFAIPQATLPYEPALETWPMALQPEGWNSNSENFGFYPTRRDGDDTYALRAWSVDQMATTFTSPLLPLNKACVLTFEYSLETQRDAEVVVDPDNPTPPDSQGPTVTLPSGYEAGWFGKAQGAGLHISVGSDGLENVLKTVTEYNGTMTEFDKGMYQQGSSTYEKVKVDIPAQGKQARIGISFLTEKVSSMYLRAIKVEDAASTAVEGIPADNSGLTVTAAGGMMTFTSDSDRTVEITNLQGARVARVTLRAGETTSVALPSGIYIAAGRKIAVK